VPGGAILLHVGPPKTGTTSIQRALHSSRSALLAEGVTYAGTSWHAWREAAAGARVLGARRRPAAAERRWASFVAHVRAISTTRVVISSEVFSMAGDDDAARIVSDLGRDRVHVVITLRPLSRILASQWQQYVRGGLRLSFADWLSAVLDGHDRDAARFWRTHHHDDLVKRWAAASAPERVTVVVVDERDRSVMRAAFEDLLGLPSGSLPEETRRANPSLGWNDAEIVRLYNVMCHRAGVHRRTAQRVRQLGLSIHRRLARGQPMPIELPAGALERSDAITREMAAGIAASGVRVVGRLDALAMPVVPPLAGTPASHTGAPPAVPRAARMAISALVAIVRVVDILAAGRRRLFRSRRG
jgi:hypothetical protein